MDEKSLGLPILRIGDNAYYDSMGGLIPCKVLSIVSEAPVQASEAIKPNSWVKVRIRLRGGSEASVWSLYVVPRAAIRRSKYATLISPYLIQVP